VAFDHYPKLYWGFSSSVDVSQRFGIHIRGVRRDDYAADGEDAFKQGRKV
jgi:hypothetical protein